MAVLEQIHWFADTVTMKSLSKFLLLSALSMFCIPMLWAQATLPFMIQNMQKDLKNRQQVAREAMRACTAVTQDKDVKDRAIAKNVLSDMGDNCVVQKPSQDSVRLLKDQIQKSFKEVSVELLWNDINKIALDKTVRSIWTTQMRLFQNTKIGKLKAMALVCLPQPKLCNNPENAEVIRLAYERFEKENEEKPIKLITAADQNKILNEEINPLISRINHNCSIAQQKFKEIKQAHSCDPLPDFSKPYKKAVPVTRIECEARTAEAHKKNKQLESLVQQSLELDMSLIVNSQLGSLLITKDLRDTMGFFKKDFAYKNCMKGEGQILNRLTNQHLDKARNDFRTLTYEELQTIHKRQSEDKQTYEKKITLRKYLKNNPSTVAEYLLQNPDRNNVFAMCSIIQDIQFSDKVQADLELAATWGGMAATIALGFGVGAPAVALLNGYIVASSGYMFGKWLSDLNTQIKDDKLIRSSVATRQKQLDQGLEYLKTSDERKDALKTNIKMAILTTAAKAVVTNGVEVASGLKKAQLPPKTAVVPTTAVKTVSKLESLKLPTRSPDQLVRVLLSSDDLVIQEGAVLELIKKTRAASSNYDKVDDSVIAAANNYKRLLENKNLSPSVHQKVMGEFNAIVNSSGYKAMTAPAFANLKEFNQLATKSQDEIFAFIKKADNGETQLAAIDKYIQKARGASNAYEDVNQATMDAVAHYSEMVNNPKYSLIVQMRASKELEAFKNTARMKALIKK